MLVLWYFDTVYTMVLFGYYSISRRTCKFFFAKKISLINSDFNLNLVMVNKS